ncbi:type 1 phosphatidylinositol 4,5-bisphosphate 4-phosphatase-like isoform X2 [Tubulanus polymorphus]|uniref:type 1 phosphatidylinositol 4,5-bisphosphate 4-phosphatase-like isoform X2 n=1 Tax=Tubulanus polymorphus TaxID=672921 RepID=UPI003DA66057
MADGRENERAPLLGDKSSNDAQLPPVYTPYPSGVANPTAAGGQTVVSVPPIGPDELPPPYTPSQTQGQAVNCKICQTPIDITGKLRQHVVKCGNCNEATPIKVAPPGKKYVRCPCNCLLICREQSQRIACPRQNCKRVIRLSSESTVTTVQSPGSLKRAVCYHCGVTFIFGRENSALARCPDCRKVSSVGPTYARMRAIIHLVIGLVFLAIAIGVTVGTFVLASEHGGYYVLWTVFYLAAIVMFARSIYYCGIGVSTVQGPYS